MVGFLINNGNVQEWFEPEAHAPQAQNCSESGQICILYVLWSNKLKKRYVGSSSNIEVRLKEHNAGDSKFTKGEIQWELLYFEEFGTSSEARRRELFLKTGVGRKFLDQKINMKLKENNK